MDIMSIALGPILFTIFGAIGYTTKNYSAKLNKVHDELMTKLDDEEVRRIIDDKNALLVSKLGDVSQDIMELKDKIDLILLHYAQKKTTHH